MRKHKHVERPGDVSAPHLVKFEAADSDLERIHARTVVAQFLVAILHLVECVDLVFVSYRQTRKLSVEGNEVRGPNRAHHEIKSLTEI